MLTELGSMFNAGAIQHMGGVLYDVITTTVHTVAGLLDLPVDVHSLESSIRFVKTSGLESSGHVPVVAAVGLTIGGGGLRRPNRASSSSPSESNTPYANFDGIAPASSSSKQVSNYPSSGFATVVPRAMFVFLMLDVLSILLVKQSMLNPCVSKLGIIQWVVGGLLLGFPSTLLVDSVRHESSFRSAFVAELVLVFVSFLWLCYGGSMIFNAVSACVDSVAPLWWLSYVGTVLSLSVAGTVIFCMVVTTVLSLVYGSTQTCMASIKETRVHLSAFNTVQDCRKFVDQIDPTRSSITVCDFETVTDKYYIPLIDRWLKAYPGRVFIDNANMKGIADPSSVPAILTARLPPVRPKLCWSGTLFYTSTKWTTLEISNPLKPDRLPLSEDLYIIGSVTHEQIMNIPLNSVKPAACTIDESLFDFSNSVILSPSADNQTCRLYLLVSRTGHTDGRAPEYFLQSIQAPDVFSSVYKSAVQVATSRTNCMEKPTYLRAIAMGRDRLEKGLGDSVSVKAVITRKQLNVMKTVARLEESVLPFFDRLRAGPVEPKDVTPPTEGSKENFENLIVNRKINALKSGGTQKKINGIFKKQSVPIGEMVLSGKRFRRMFGTSFNSIEWPLPNALTRDQTADGPLASEVVGELSLLS